MLESEMASMCAITIDPDKDAAVYPNVEDKAELRVGDVVFFTATLVNVDNTTAVYSLPGTIFDKGEGKLAVRPCPTKLWEIGWTEITEVMVGDTDIRFVTSVDDLDDDQLIRSHWVDPIDEVAVSCVNDLIKADKNFKTYLDGYIKRKKNGPPDPKCEFLCAVIEKMASSMTINEWREQRPSNRNSHSPETFESWIENNYTTPVIAEKTSSMTEEKERLNYKKKVSPTIKATAKYLAMLMNIMISACGPVAPKDPETGGVNGGQDIKEILASVKDLAMKLETM